MKLIGSAGISFGEIVNRIHPISWEKLCIPKKFGGLGLHSARNMNKVSFMKAGWQLCNNRSDLWV
jgi:hypothetical protein